MNSQISINKSAEQLAHSNKELEAFIYNAAHDLKGPLAASKGLVHLALSSKDPKEVNQYLDLIGSSLEKLDQILMALHEVALIRHGKPDFKKLDLENILFTLLSNFKGYPNFDNIKFILRNETSKEFFSDEILIQTALRNIIENGIKYAKPGSSDSFVKILIKESEAGILIEVSDNGIGIPDKFHDKVFDSFFRATQISSGSGLGLYIVKNAIDKLNGKISIFKSEENQGTLFHLLLPNNSLKIVR
jgi:signal transduction histidine kinase